MKETLRHKEAFEYYYSLGSERNIPKVVQQYSVSVAAVKKWSKEFNWQERIMQRDIENSKKLAKKTDTAVVNEKANYRKIIKHAVAEWQRKFAKGEITTDSVQDLERLVKLDLLLMGENTEIINQDITVKMEGELAEWAK